MSLKNIATLSLLVAAALLAACTAAPPPAPAPAEAPPPVIGTPDARPAAAATPEPTQAPAATAAMTASVTGNVTYRIRKALPPEAVIRIQLLDASRVDQPARVLGEQTIEAKGRQVPFAYKVPYDPKAIAAKSRYRVNATVTVNNEVWFVTDGAAWVITGGNSKRRDIVVKQAKRP